MHQYFLFRPAFISAFLNIKKNILAKNKFEKKIFRPRATASNFEIIGTFLVA